MFLLTRRIAIMKTFTKAIRNLTQHSKDLNAAKKNSTIEIQRQTSLAKQYEEEFLKTNFTIKALEELVNPK